jgi:K+ transporter
MIIYFHVLAILPALPLDYAGQNGPLWLMVNCGRRQPILSVVLQLPLVGLATAATIVAS